MTNKVTKIKVGIIRGGMGEHYNSSLTKGGEIISHVLSNLSDKYKTVDILIDKEGEWHTDGFPISPTDLVNKVDIIWNTSEHPSLPMTLDSLSIPHIKNNIFLKSLENDRSKLEKHIKNIGIKMPRSMILPSYQEDFDGPREKYVIKKAKEVFEKFSSPWVVKSFIPDSNQGIHLAKTFPELVNAIEDGVKHQKSILVEEFITGKKTSVHSISNFRNENIYVLPINGSFLNSEKEKIIDLIKNLHAHLEIEHYLKSDIILHPKRGFFLTNIEFSPDFRAESPLEQSCNTIGLKIYHIFEHVLEKTFNR